MPKSDPIKKSYERAFTGVNRRPAMWAAFQAGWNAAKPSDQAIYDNIADRYFRDTAQPVPLTDEALEAMWEADTTSAEDCASLYFFKFVARAVERAHGIGISLVGLGQRDSLVAWASDVDQRVTVPAAGADEEAAGLVNLGFDRPEHDAKTTGTAGPHGEDGTPVSPCPLCDARPDQEHASACPRNPSDPTGVRRRRNG